MIIRFLLKSIYKKLILIAHTIRVEIKEIKYPTKTRYKDLINSYKASGLSIDRESHINRLNKCLNFLDLPEYSEKEGMYSEHLIIFSAISNSSFKPKRILEIGTYDGKTAAILSYLFPDAKIITIDLNDSDPLFKSTYNRNFNLKLFLRRRNDILNKNKNIKFIQCNSLELTLKNDIENQDLIWVDGAHGYPTAAIDITNSIKLLNQNGILMCDDVWKNLNQNDSIYQSIASYETLNAFSKIKLLNTIFFHKRICKKYNLNNKYIGFSKKLSN